MINILLFLVFLVNGIQGSPQQEFAGELGSFMMSADTNYAGVILQTDAKLYGIGGTIAIYNPKVDHYQSSAAAVWIRNGPPQNSNIIIVGWHVNPQIYNDTKTHLFIYWTKDSFKIGCYNLLCSGFVHTDKTITPGQPLETSTVNGTTKTTNELDVSILQDPVTTHWGVTINEKTIGYFPQSLFSNMSSFDQAAWMGITANPLATLSPPMGSEVLSDGNLNSAAYFKDLDFVDDFRKNQPLQRDMAPIFTSTSTKCYNAQYFDSPVIGLSLQFGGPGGKCGV